MNDELRKMAESVGFQPAWLNLWGPNFEAFARLVAESCINPWPPHWCVPVPEGCDPYSFGEGMRCMQDAIRAKYGIKP